MITVFFIDPNDLTPQLNYPLLESLDQKEELDIRYFTSVNRYASEYYTKHYKVKKKIVFFRLANKIKNNGLRRLVKALSYPFNSLELIFHVFRKKPDILHYSSIDIPFIDFFILGLFRLFRFKIILTKHNYIEHESKKLGFFRYQILKLVDNIVVLSGYTKSLFDRRFDDKITLIGHGNCYNKEIELFGKNKTRKEKESFTVLYIGIIRKYKGIDDLIEAINQIVNQWKYQDIQFRIYGNCHQNIDQEILRKIKEYDLEEYVDFKNLFVPYDELIENIVDCDMGVLPYKRASQSGIPYLYLIQRRPLLVTNVGALPEQVIPELSEIVDPEPESIARGIIHVKNRIQTGEIKDSSFSRFIRENKWQNRVDEYRENYKKVKGE